MTEQSETSANEYTALLHLDYEQTLAQFTMYADIRFKLLAFVPTLTGAAVALLTSDKSRQDSALPLGILGFVVTVGIILYELRNTLFYEMSAIRASRLEKLLEFPRFSELRRNTNTPGGIFTERTTDDKKSQDAYPLIQRLGGIIPVRHDLGLAFIYGASLAGWTYLVVNALLFDQGNHVLFSFLAAAVVLFLTILQFIILDERRRKWRNAHVKAYNLYTVTGSETTRQNRRDRTLES
jgi:hypothetical protein